VQQLKEVYRLIDANLNRAVEGIRVLEETARMIHDNSDVTARVKRLRHEITDIVRKDDELSARLIGFRGSDRDVLRDGEIPTEAGRGDILDIVAANARRAQEAVRTVEEYIKLVKPPLSKTFKAFRFSLYDIEKEIAGLCRKNRLLDRRRLGIYTIVDAGRIGMSAIPPTVSIIRDAGGTTISLSDPAATDREKMERAGVFVDSCRRADAAAIVCSRPDIAVMAGADGVELADDDLLPRDCARLTGPGRLIGGRFDSGTVPGNDFVDALDYVILGIKDLNDFTDRASPAGTGAPAGKFHVPILLAGISRATDPKPFLDGGITGFAVVFDDDAPALIARLRHALDQYACQGPGLRGGIAPTETHG